MDKQQTKVNLMAELMKINHKMEQTVCTPSG